MALSDAQLERLVAQELGAKLRERQPLGERTQRLTLGDGRRVVLRQSGQSDEWAAEPVAAEVRALRAMVNELDQPLPELLACNLDDEPWALLSCVEGLPLPQVLPELSEAQRYDVGRAIGELMLRVHMYTLPEYGPLPASASLWQLDRREPPPPPDSAGLGKKQKPPKRPEPTVLPPLNTADVVYLHRRLDRALDGAMEAGELNEETAAQVRGWVSANSDSTGHRASLVHGDLRPERMLLRQDRRGWRLAGLVGWGYAQAWRPGWDHVLLMDTCAGNDYFSLRVGYGNAYDETNQRAYDQVRPLALLPYRLIFYLEAGRADLALRELHVTTSVDREGRTVVEE
ncbi:MAG: phosphotransferase [Chloroflexaceae bacterium]|jgi:aminoglycoside phosphotransferase (APT) family kinase protein|nr:phosphotransferase [Chloroflexaceae bacterium]